MLCTKQRGGNVILTHTLTDLKFSHGYRANWTVNSLYGQGRAGKGEQTKKVEWLTCCLACKCSLVQRRGVCLKMYSASGTCMRGCLFSRLVPFSYVQDIRLRLLSRDAAILLVWFRRQSQRLVALTHQPLFSLDRIKRTIAFFLMTRECNLYRF